MQRRRQDAGATVALENLRLTGEKRFGNLGEEKAKLLAGWRTMRAARIRRFRSIAYGCRVFTC
jgi:hypothetical protein